MRQELPATILGKKRYKKNKRSHGDDKYETAINIGGAFSFLSGELFESIMEEKMKKKHAPPTK